MSRLLLLFSLLVLSQGAFTNVLTPFDDSALIPEQFPDRAHPKKPANAAPSLLERPIETNIFYGNLINDGDGNQNVYSLPYAIHRVTEAPFGFAVGQTDEKSMGAERDGCNYYYWAPIADQFIFTASEFNNAGQMQVSDSQRFSVHAQSSWGDAKIDLPITIGQAYVTAIYTQATPKFTFGEHKVLTINKENAAAGQTYTGNKFLLSLDDKSTLILYTFGAGDVNLVYNDNALTSTAKLPTLTARLAKIAPGADVALGESIYDQGADSYATTFNLGAEVDFDALKGRYTFAFKVVSASGKQQPGPYVHYAYNHHQQVLQTTNGVTITDLQLQAPSKGAMNAVVSTGPNFTWVLNEDSITDIRFKPKRDPDANKVDIIRAQLRNELIIQQADDVDIKPNSGSYYNDGKNLFVNAQLLVVSDVVGDTASHNKILAKMKRAFNPMMDGQVQSRLVYDTTWKGIASTDGMDNSGADFGNGYYNDHHFHWGYIIHAAAIVQHYDPTFAPENSAIRKWIDALTRDVMNTDSESKLFPLFRSFDWWSGHAWANGIFAPGDGKDQESTSESVNMHYAAMLWGAATGKPGLEHLGALMMAVEARAVKTYYQIRTNNTIHPAGFRCNKHVGIIFELKAAHETWFGANKEYVHGIQMIPMLPTTPLVRSPDFVKEEWDAQGFAALANDLYKETFWGTILYTNYALVDKELAFEKLQDASYDGGIFKSWTLFYAATAEPYKP